MTEYTQPIAGAAWEVAGRRVAASLDSATSALVIGDDPIAAASAALGIARVQAARRRVAVADLVGEAPPLEELVTDGDAHGISDSFQFGVSLNRIAHQVDEAGSLFIMPSGSEPVITDEVFRSERWRLLADSYDKAGSLLLIVAPADAPGLGSLGRFVNGVVLAGDVDARRLGGVRVISTVAAPAVRAFSATPEATPLTAEALVEPGVRPTKSPRVVQPERKSRVPLAAAGALVAAAAAWFAFSGGGAETSDEDAAAADSTTTVASVGAVEPRPAGEPASPGPAPVAGAAAVGSRLRTLVVNPADSARAARFTVLISTFPTVDRAWARLAQDAPDIAAATLSPAPAVPRYQYVAGAFGDRGRADSLLAALRRRSAVGSRGGSVIDRPLAFLLREGVRADSIAPLVRAFRAKRVPVYVLLQADGSARLFAGAYESEQQATTAAAPLRAAGVDPVLAYRTGTPQ